MHGKARESVAHGILAPVIRKEHGKAVLNYDWVTSACLSVSGSLRA